MVQRIEILGVPVDVCPKSELEQVVLELLEEGRPAQIMFISIWDLIKARGKNDYAECVRNADLILPVSKSILFGAKFLKMEIPVRYNPFPAVIRILNVLESRYKTFYMLGGRRESLLAAEKNIRQTFKELHIVGRYVGYYKNTSEDIVVEAIHKASPSLVLLSDGVKEKDCWAYKRREKFSTSVFLYYKDAIGIFSKRIKRVNEKTFEKGNEIFGEVLRNPLRLFLIFPYLRYVLLLIGTRLFKNRKR